MAYTMNALYIEWILKQIAKVGKTTSFLFRAYMSIELAAWLLAPCLDRDKSDGNH